MIGGNVKWQIDSSSTLTFQPAFSVSNSNGRDDANSSTNDNFKGPINRNENDLLTNGNRSSYHHSLNFFSWARKKMGRSFSANLSTSFSSGGNNHYEEGLYTFYANAINDSLVNFLRKNDNGLLRHSVRFHFNQPITKWATLSMNYNATYEKEKAMLDLYSKPVGANAYTVYNEALSNGRKKDGWEQTAEVGVSAHTGEWSFDPGIEYFWFRSLNKFPKNSVVNQHIVYLYPKFKIQWKSFSLDYSANVSPPDANELQPVIDISNPLYKEYGNPNLQPLYTQEVSFGFFHYFMKSGSSLNLSLSSSREKNAAISQTILDSNRVEITRPINIDGTRHYFINVDYSRRFRFHKNFHLSVHPNGNVNIEQRFVFINSVLSKVWYTYADLQLNIALNYNDRLELTQHYKVRLNQSRYENTTNYHNASVVSHQLQSELIFRWPKRVVWESEVNYLYNPQVGPGLRKSSVRWNSSVYYAFLKNETAQVKLSAFDLLNQNVNIYRYTGEGAILNTQSMTLQRYFMLSFVFNIRYFSPGKKENDTSFDFD